MIFISLWNINTLIIRRIFFQLPVGIKIKVKNWLAPCATGCIDHNLHKCIYNRPCDIWKICNNSQYCGDYEKCDPVSNNSVKNYVKCSKDDNFCASICCG